MAAAARYHSKWHLHAHYMITCKPLLGIDITTGGVLCEEPSRAVRKLESNIRLQSSRIKEFIEGLERYLNSSTLQVKFVYSCFFLNETEHSYHSQAFETLLWWKLIYTLHLIFNLNNFLCLSLLLRVLLSKSLQSAFHFVYFLLLCSLGRFCRPSAPLMTRICHRIA